jgi:hypothetical protein
MPAQVLRPDVHRGTVALVTGGGTDTGTTVVVDGGADAWGNGHPAPQLEVAQ